MHKEFMHAPPLPVHRLPGGHLMGWHLWVEMEPMRDRTVRLRPGQRAQNKDRDAHEHNGHYPPPAAPESGGESK